MIATALQFDDAEGERRKDSILATLAAHREACVNRGRRALLLSCLRCGTASADDVRRAVALPDEIDPRCLGSVPGPLARAGIIRRADFAKSARPERHASYIAQWELIDAEAARAWLAFHPDIADPSIFDTNETPDAATSGASKN